MGNTDIFEAMLDSIHLLGHNDVVASKSSNSRLVLIKNYHTDLIGVHISFIEDVVELVELQCELRNVTLYI